MVGVFVRTDARSIEKAVQIDSTEHAHAHSWGSGIRARGPDQNIIIISCLESISGFKVCWGSSAGIITGLRIKLRKEMPKEEVIVVPSEAGGSARCVRVCSEEGLRGDDRLRVVG